MLKQFKLGQLGMKASALTVALLAEVQVYRRRAKLKISFSF